MFNRAIPKGQRFTARMAVLTTVFLLAMLANALTATAAPTTVLNAVPSAPNGDAGWYKTAPSVYLWAMGEDTTYSPSAVTYYSWDSTSSWQTYNGPLVAAEGVHFLLYYSEDTSGVEPVQLRAFNVDITAPTNPTASSPGHTVGGSSNDNTIDMNFSGAADAVSGVDGFSFTWSQSATATPDAIKDLEEDAGSTTSPALADGTWYFHLRTKDNAGNWSAPVHSGPYTIVSQDATPPTTTLIADPALPSGENGWYLSIPALILTADESCATYYQWNATDPSGWTVYAGAVLGGSAGANTLYFYSVDGAGNVETVKSQSINVDNAAPTNPTASSPGHTVGGSSIDNTIDMNFSGAADAVSGVDGFSFTWSQSATATPDAIKDLEEDAGSTTSPALADGTWYFHLRTKDNAGNWSAPIHSGPYTIVPADTTPPVTTLTSTKTTVTLTSNEQGTTYYKWDTGAWQVYAAPMPILKGTHTLYYYSVDLAGNVETTKSKVLKGR